MSFFKKLFQKKETEKPIKTYKDFWDWFIDNEKKFHSVVESGDSARYSAEFFDVIAPKLDQLKEGIWYLCGMLDDNTADFILTSDGNLANYYVIEELIAAAPSLPNWVFKAHKPSFKQTGIKMHGSTFGVENMYFYSNDNSEYPDEIDITIIHDDYSEENKDKIIQGSYIFLDNYLGEIKTTTIIDFIDFKPKSEAEKELVPIEKLDDFLTWRQKEFIEKYQGTRHNTDEDGYVSLETTLKNGNPLFSIMNSDLLEWDATASHPWLVTVKVVYEGENNNGLPEKEDYELLNKMEDEINEHLKDFEGYLNIGRETGDNIRETFFACKDFRKPSKVLDTVLKNYKDNFEVNYEIKKDKYWQRFNWHRKGLEKNIE